MIPTWVFMFRFMDQGLEFTDPGSFMVDTWARKKLQYHDLGSTYIY